MHENLLRSCKIRGPSRPTRARARSVIQSKNICQERVAGTLISLAGLHCIILSDGMSQERYTFMQVISG